MHLPAPAAGGPLCQLVITTIGRSKSGPLPVPVLAPCPHGPRDQLVPAHPPGTATASPLLRGNPNSHRSLYPKLHRAASARGAVEGSSRKSTCESADLPCISLEFKIVHFPSCRDGRPPGHLFVLGHFHLCVLRRPLHHEGRLQHPVRVPVGRVARCGTESR